MYFTCFNEEAIQKALTEPFSSLALSPLSTAVDTPSSLRWTKKQLSSLQESRFGQLLRIQEQSYFPVASEK